MTRPKTENRKPKTENESLTDLDRAILNEIQSHFPIESRPYAVVGERVGASEAEVLERVAAMTEAGIIRRLGANFASRKLGYTSTLCAARVPPDKLEQFVAVVNHYPGVTHNYLRRHHFNVWFTLIAKSWEKSAGTRGPRSFSACRPRKFSRSKSIFRCRREAGAGNGFFPASIQPLILSGP
jgi:DNA-binding Lrp family transcriptional regulator